VESIEAVLENADIRDAVLHKKREKERVVHNQKVGTLVEQLLQKELQSCGIQVTRTGVGSDFELETDFVEDGQEQLLKVSQYLLEVKSTSAPFIRMTLRQGQEATKAENRDNYVLCVVNLSEEAFDEQLVRDSASFVFDVGPMVELKVEEAKSLKDLEAQMSPHTGNAVEIDIDKSSIKLRIKEEVWIKQGVNFQNFVARVKPNPSIT
jgi:hypothetical protein